MPQQITLEEVTRLTALVMASAEASLQLGLLQEVFCRHLLPLLSLQALQSFSQACKAAITAVSSLPDALLHQLAQVRLHLATLSELRLDLLKPGASTGGAAARQWCRSSQTSAGLHCQAGSCGEARAAGTTQHAGLLA